MQAMTNDERYIIEVNIEHYQAMLDIDDEKRFAVERLLAEAEEVLATDFSGRVKDIGSRRVVPRNPNGGGKFWSQRNVGRQWTFRRWVIVASCSTQ
jgi:hypothetical protein